MSASRPPPVKGVNFGRDADGRLVGLSKVENHVKKRCGAIGARNSPWRRGFTKKAAALHDAWERKQKEPAA